MNRNVISLNLRCWPHGLSAGVVYSVLLDEVQCVQDDLALDSLSLALIVVMINTSHSRLTLFHSRVCDGCAEV